MKNSKFEIRSTKRYQNSNVRMFKTFRILNFGHLNLFRISKFDIRIYRALALLSCCAFIYLAAGCEETGSKTTLADKYSLLQQEQAQLTHKVEQLESENEQLQERIQVLSGLPDGVKGKNLYELKSVKITRYTNLYDNDKDGKKEKLIVYIRPMDAEGDIIKAAGTADVQLWDLNKDEEEALLGKWQVKPEELKKLWFDALLGTNYRLTFNIADKISKYKEPLTVKVTFTDYLSGKVFKEQRVIKP